MECKERWKHRRREQRGDRTASGPWHGDRLVVAL